MRDNLQIKFAESFTKLGLIRLENQTVAITFLLNASAITLALPGVYSILGLYS